MKSRQNSPFNLADLLETHAKRAPNQKALIDAENSDPTYTWKEFNEEANRIGNWATSVGLKHGDVVALYMNNRTIYPIVWCGLAKVGVTTALVNHNQEGKALLHSIKEAKAQHIIVDGDLTRATDSVRSELPNCVWYFLTGQKPPAHYEDLEESLKKQTTQQPSRPPNGKATDPLVLVYTSGTTGLPKAAVITHLRFFGAGSLFSGQGHFNEADRIYTALPLYHSAGGMIGVGSALVTGCSIVVRRKFSAKNYISDCRKHGCTVAQYIGEILRYVLAVPPSTNDTNHKLRYFLGNGCRPEIFDEVIKRFGAIVFEFYGATEGNVTLLNPHGKSQAVGYMPPLIQKISPYKIVKFDVSTEMPIRNTEGFCERVQPGETGEALGLIRPNDPVTEFRGYTSEAATDKKTIRDAFEKGDAYFRTGDLLRIDSDGYCYFVDRIGDTFRWKGENVATTEVSEVLNTIPGIEESIVFGVTVPGHDGRACMAGLVTNETFDLNVFWETVGADLPTYARPIFLRLLPRPELTGTFKHQKARLKAEGFSLNSGDKVMIRDRNQARYIELNQAGFDNLQSGKTERL